MAIPYWRYKEYTDDGCAIFQCLSCYGQWEMRGRPRDWKHCPYCGIQWKGQHVCRPSDESRYEAFTERRIHSRGVFRLFTIEERKLFHHSDGTIDDKGWSTFTSFDRKEENRSHVLAYLNTLRERYNEQRAEELAEDSGWATSCYEEKQYRIVIRTEGSLFSSALFNSSPFSL